MQKAVDSVKRKEDRPRRFDDYKPRDKKPFEKKSFNKVDKVSDETSAKEDSSKKVSPAKEEKPVVKESKKETVDLSKLTVSELREAAKEKNIKGYSTMKKAELIDALK
ncbi:MAG: Rho termination factor N-terminal domain-containing protein [Clostridium sp.]|nr:Rho termination factor N-terminal domain-containing protein [Clostridium sp.]